jgi:hypothetical protein
MLTHKVCPRDVVVEATKLILVVRQTLEFEWAVPETATLVKKARLRQRLSVYVSPSRRGVSQLDMGLSDHASQSEPCEGWKLSASTVRFCVMLPLPPLLQLILAVAARRQN